MRHRYELEHSLNGAGPATHNEKDIAAKKFEPQDMQAAQTRTVHKAVGGKAQNHKLTSGFQLQRHFAICGRSACDELCCPNHNDESTKTQE